MDFCFEYNWSSLSYAYQLRPIFSDFWRIFLQTSIFDTKSISDKSFEFLRNASIFEKRFCVWPKFWFFDKIFDFLTKVLIFWEKFRCFPNVSMIWHKFWSLDKSFDFCQKLHFCQKFQLFDFWQKRFYFWQNFRFVQKKCFDIWQKFRFLTKSFDFFTKVSIFKKRFDLWQKVSIFLQEFQFIGPIFGLFKCLTFLMFLNFCY